MKRQWVYRTVMYLLGMLILAFGLSMNTKAGLGVSAIISVSYSISLVSGSNFGNTTFGLYILFVVLQIILHYVRIKRYKKEAKDNSGSIKEKAFRLVFIIDILQIPLSIVFTRFLNVFTAVIPDFSQMAQPGPERISLQLVALFVAIACTGIGAAMSLNMRIVPNPGDGIVQALADFFRKEVGLMKNFVDGTCIVISGIIGFACAGHLAGVGIGTICAVVGTGRVIAIFNRMFRSTMIKKSGLERI